MAIKIPGAQEIGIGRRTPGAIAEGLARPVQEIKTGIGLEAAQAALQLAGQVVSVQKIAKAKAAKEAEIGRAKVQKAIGIMEKNQANTDFANMNAEFTAEVDALKAQNLPVAESAKRFNELITKKEGAFRSLIPKTLQSSFEATLINNTTRATSAFTKHTTDIVNSTAMAQGKTTMEGIVQRVGATPEDRIDGKAQISMIVDVLPMSAEAKTALRSKYRADIDANAVAQRLAEREGGVYRTDLDGLIEDLEAKDADGNFKNFKDLPAKSRTILKKQAEDARLTDNNTRAAEVKSQNKTILKNLKEAVSYGIPLSPQDVKALEERFAGTELEKAFKETLKEGIDPLAIQRKFQEKPLEVYAAQNGIIVDPIDFTGSPEEVQEQLVKRMALGTAARNTTGSRITPVLLSSEVKDVIAIVKKDPIAGVNIMESMMQFVGPVYSKGVAAQVAQVDPATGTVLRALADGDKEFALNLIEGQELRKTGAVKIPTREVREWFVGSAGVALTGYSNNGIEAYDAFLSMYAVGAQGLPEDDLDSDIADAAFAKVVGNVESVNGYRTILQPGLQETDFLDGIGSINGAFVASMGGVPGMTDEEAAEELRNDGQWYSAGEDLYRVKLDGKVVITGLGSNIPFQLDVSALKNKPNAPIPTTTEQQQVEFGFGLF